MTQFQTLSLEINDGTATLTLAQPKIGNVLGAQSGLDLRDATVQISRNASVRLLVIKAEGRAFCLGGNLAEFAETSDLAPAIHHMVLNFHAACANLAGLEIPILCVVQGPVAGAGLAFLCLADYVLGASTSSYTYAYPGVGFSSDGGLTWLLPKIMGLRAFRSFVAAGKSLTATEALAAGLISELVEEPDLDRCQAQWTQLLASGPTQAFGAVRNLAFDGFAHSYPAHLQRESEAIIGLANTADAQSAIASVLRRERPIFAGK